MKVVVMSATLEVDKLSEFFGHCSVLHIPGRSYPVKEIFCNLLSPRDTGSSAYVTEVWPVLLDFCVMFSARSVIVVSVRPQESSVGLLCS